LGALLVVVLLLGSLPSVAAKTASATPVTVTFSVGQPAVPGESWYDGERLWTFGRVFHEEVSGGLTGQATIELDQYWEGPCDLAAMTCQGPLYQWLRFWVWDDAGGWDGHGVFLFDGPEMETTVVLIGHGAYQGQTLWVDQVLDFPTESITYSGLLLEAGGSTPDVPPFPGGLSFHGVACLSESGITGSVVSSDAGWNGATLKGQALAPGWPTPEAVARSLTITSGDGRTLELAFAADGHANGQCYGEIALLGHDGLVGQGRLQATLDDGIGCPDGAGLNVLVLAATTYR
jgi:hypothetical protein